MALKLKPYPEYKESGVPWLGKIPNEWVIGRLKNLCRFAYGDSLPNDKRKDGVVKVYGSNGVVGTHVRANTKGACLVIGRKGSFGKINYSKEAVFAIDTTFYVDQRCTRARLRWLYYLLIWARLDGVSRDSAVPGLDREEAYKQILLCCPIEDQIQIAKFLDNQISLIHSLIRAKLRLIERLNEQKQAIIHHAVTRGSDPNVRLKPSGIDWLGDVPEHWEVKRIKQVARIVRGKFGHRPRNDPDLYDGAYPFIQTGDVSRAAKFITKYGQTLNDRGLAISKMFPSGTLAMTIAANIGDVAVLSFDACFPDSIVGFETCPLMNRDYLYYVFSCMKQEFLREAPVNTQGNLNVERLGTQTVPCPPLSEQQKIVINIEGKIKSLGECIDNFRLEIDLLREYRTRLIADVVTGKLDVTGVKIEQGDGETDFLEDFEENEAEIDSDKEIDAMEGVNE